MAQTFSNELAPLNAVPPGKIDGALMNGRVRVYRSTVTYAAQAAADTVVLSIPTPGDRPLALCLNTSVSTGAATLAFGNDTTPAKFGAAAAYTSANVPVWVMLNAPTLTDIAVGERLVMTIAAAALPASGNLTVDLYTTAP